jgi:hypothetical protein
MLATAGVVMLANPALPIADDLLALVLGIEYSPRPGSSGATLHQMRYPRRDRWVIDETALASHRSCAAAVRSSFHSR